MCSNGKSRDAEALIRGGADASYDERNFSAAGAIGCVRPVRHPVRLERDRLTILHGLDILDTPPEREFDSIVAAAQALLGCKIALVSLVDRDRQWFKARYGLAATETPRELAFCAHAAAADDTLVVLDTTRDRRFCDPAYHRRAVHLLLCRRPDPRPRSRWRRPATDGDAMRDR